MKFGFIADIHLSINDSMSPFDVSSGFSIRTLDRLAALKEALEISVSNSCEYFIIGGDIYDKLNPSEKLKEAFLEVILKFSKRIKIIIFPGNHDGTEFTNNYLSEKIILSYLDVKLFTVISKITTLYSSDGKEKMMFIPWTTDLEKIKESINEVEPGLICFGHLEISGAVSSTEYTLTTGLHPGIFSKFKIVFLGHYHRHQVIKNIVYVGSPIIKDFSELEINKGFIIYDSLTQNWTFYQLEKRKVFEFVISEETLDEVDNYLENNEIPEGSLFKLKFKGSRAWVGEISPIVYQLFNEFKPLKIKREKTIEKDENKPYQHILILKNRIERIKEFSKDQTPEIIKLGMDLYLKAEQQYLGAEE